MTLTLREASTQDLSILFEWFNDPSTRRGYFSAEPIAWDEHVAWFERMQSEPRTRIYIVESDAEAVGQVRFSVDEDEQISLSISIIPERRGTGLGREALRQACVRYLSNLEIDHLVAWVKPENHASLRIFQAVGFQLAAQASWKGQPALCLHLDRAMLDRAQSHTQGPRARD